MRLVLVSSSDVSSEYTLYSIVHRCIVMHHMLYVKGKRDVQLLRHVGAVRTPQFCTVLRWSLRGLLLNKCIANASH